jgi:hypothetical protein
MVIGSIIILLIVILILILVTLLRFFITPTPKYGNFVTLKSSSCTTSDGLCSSTGTQELIEGCLVSTNGLGCLVNGKQAFGIRIKKTPCTKECNTSNWIINRSGCIPTGTTDYQGNRCVEESNKGYNRISYTCQRRDAVGQNNCTLNITPSSLDTIPEGCTLITPTLLQCQIGSSLTISQECQLNRNVYPLCGQYLLDDGNSCPVDLSLNLQEKCYAFDSESTATPLNHPEDILSPGYLLEDLKCSTAGCKAIPDCATTGHQIYDILGYGSPVYSCDAFSRCHIKV